MTNRKTPQEDVPGCIQLSVDRPATYRICVKGNLAAYWSDRMEGLQIDRQVQADGSMVTTLQGQLRDQAALSGVLTTLYDMRLPLISVECLGVT